jgi:hypothetical protein
MVTSTDNQRILILKISANQKEATEIEFHNSYFTTPISQFDSANQEIASFF